MTAKRMADGRHPASPGTLDVLLAIFDFPILAAGFRAAIEGEPDMRVVPRSPRRESLAEDIAASGADVVVTECLAPGGGACAAYASIEAIRAACPEAKLIAFDCRCASEQFTLALRAGANGFLTREAEEADVAAAVRTVASGETYLCPTIVTRMVNAYVRRTSEAGLEDPYEALSEREREVLLLASIGHTNREIAATLHVSEQTVHYHRANVMEKLGLHDRVELLRYTVRRGLVDASTL